jgi:hypothetical protein
MNPGYNNTPSHGVSRALGRLNPKQAAEMNEHLRKQGVTSAEFQVGTGYGTWSDKKGRDALLKFHDAIDNDGINRKD